jgi:hypothetical protein
MREPKPNLEPHWEPYPHLKGMEWNWKAGEAGKVRMDAGWIYTSSSERATELVSAQNALRTKREAGNFKGIVPEATAEDGHLVADAPTKGVHDWELPPELWAMAKNRVGELVAEAKKLGSRFLLSTNPDKYVFYSGTGPVELAGVIGSPFKAWVKAICQQGWIPKQRQHYTCV